MAPAAVGIRAAGEAAASLGQRACPLCGSGDLQPVLDLVGVPVFCNVLWPDASSALGAPRGDVALTFCTACGALYNRAFDAEAVRYAPGYENSLHFSPGFSAYADRLAQRLVGRHGLRGGAALEIGCGRGDFLSLLVRHGAGSARGYDPSLPADVTSTTDGVTLVSGPFPEEPGSIDARLICCRHVLEHLADPYSLLATLRRAIGDGTPLVYLEVPDGGHLLVEHAIWDIIYEHPWHFTLPAFRRLVTAAGFSIVEAGSTFGGQFLYLDARVAAVGGDGLDEPDAAVLAGLGLRARTFAAQFASAVAGWDGHLRSQIDAGRVAVWGAGSKGTTFLNVVPSATEVGCVIDINPRKHGRYVPGTGQRVAGPEALRGFAPHVVLVMNPLYAEEVGAMCRNLGVRADIVAVGGEGPADPPR